MDHETAAPPPWVRAVCAVARDFRIPGNERSVWELFRAAAPDLSDPGHFRDLVAVEFRRTPELLATWYGYSDNKRTSEGPYLLQDNTVGYFVRGEGLADEVRHALDGPAAAADFLYREATLVLEGRRASPDG